MEPEPRKNFGYVKQEIEHMNIMGYIPSTAKLLDLPYRDFVNPDFDKFLREKGGTFDLDAFHVTNPTFRSVNQATLKYNRGFKDCPPQKLFADAFQDLVDCFSPLIGRCPIRPLDEILVSPDTSSGFVAKKVFNCAKKGDALYSMWEYIHFFSENAHLQNYPVLWKQSGKVEMLKKLKIDAQDIRVFTIIPIELFMFRARLFQAQNEMMVEPEFWKNSVIKHGIVMQERGFLDLLHELTVQGWFWGEGDVRKYDSSFPFWLFSVCLLIRILMWDGQGMSVEEFSAKAYYSYEQVLNSYLLLPSGQIIQKYIGNPSGQESTTDDNCIGHTFIWCLTTRAKFKCSLMQLIPTHMRIALYADDHLFTVDPKLGLDKFEVRKLYYGFCGFDLDPSKDFVSNSPEGHTFLGLTAKWDNRFQAYVPHFSELKAINSLHKSRKGVKTIEYYQKILSICILCAFTDLFDLIFEWAVKYRSMYPSALRAYPLFPKNLCQNFWLNRESGVDREVVLKLTFQSCKELGVDLIHGPSEALGRIEGWKNHSDSIQRASRSIETIQTPSRCQSC